MKINIHVFLSVLSALALLTSITFIAPNNAFAQQGSLNISSSGIANLQPNINAESIFDTKTMTLGNNIQNFVILIPNEGHHGEGEENEARFLDQHFVPENAAVNVGTTLLWFNGDVGHERTIDVKGSDGNSVFNTGLLQIVNHQGHILSAIQEHSIMKQKVTQV